MRRLAALAGLVLAAGPVGAAERGVTITEFDRIRVEGSFLVDVKTGRGPSARLSGSPAALETVSIQVQGRTLVVRRRQSTWGGYPGADTGPVSVRVTTPVLQSAALTGSGVVRVDRVVGQRVELIVDGSGRVSVDSIVADRASLVVSGSGTMTGSGKVAQLEAQVRGAGSLDTADLDVADLRLTQQGSGSVTMRARRSATINAFGSGTVNVDGTPACTVKNSGSGSVVCGQGSAGAARRRAGS